MTLVYDMGFVTDLKEILIHDDFLLIAEIFFILLANLFLTLHLLQSSIKVLEKMKKYINNAQKKFSGIFITCFSTFTVFKQIILLVMCIFLYCAQIEKSCFHFYGNKNVVKILYVVKIFCWRSIKINNG